MITNRPHIQDLIDAVPQKYKSEVATALDDLDAQGLSPQQNAEHIRFNKYKIEVAGGDVEIIFEYDLTSGNIRIIDIKTRANIKAILKKIRRAIEIGP
jgi:hypothetical protein